MIRYQKPLPTPGRPSDKSQHVFSIGQRVRRKSRFGLTGAAFETFVITRTLPPTGGVLQYRIRSEDERHERMTTEDDLEAFETDTLSETVKSLEGTN